MTQLFVSYFIPKRFTRQMLRKDERILDEKVLPTKRKTFEIQKCGDGTHNSSR